VGERNNTQTAPRNNKTAQLTVADLAEAKRLPVEFLSGEVGLRDLPGGVGIPYHNAAGEEIAVKRRTALKATEGSYWPQGQPLAAYGIWRIDRANRAGFLILAEGESDVWTLWHHGLPALGLPGSNTAKTLEWEHVAAVSTVYVVREPDTGGDSFVPGVAARLKVIGYRGDAFELRMPDGVKDPSDLHVKDPERFRAVVEKCVVTSARLCLGAAVDEDREGLATTFLTRVRPMPVHWLVPGYLPLGKLVLLAGDGGHGKSCLTLGLSACLTTGRPCLGLDYPPLPPADVLLISCEDDYADTVVPRLLSAGADLGRIRKVDGVQSKDGKVLPFNLAYFEALRQELKASPNVRLVVIDPAGAYIGKAGIDDYKDSELRALLGPLSELAAECQVTIVLVKHLVKGATSKAVHKVGGSAAYVNAVRAAFVVAPDPDEPARKFFLPIKFNLGPLPSGLAYRLASLSLDDQSRVLAPFDHLEEEDRARLGEQLFRVDWEGAVAMTADQALGDVAKRDRGPRKVPECVEWLEAFLSPFAWPSEEVRAAAEKEGFAFSTLKEAKAVLKSQGKARYNNSGRFKGEWWCGLGDPRDWRLRPDTPASPARRSTTARTDGTADGLFLSGGSRGSGGCGPSGGSGEVATDGWQSSDPGDQEALADNPFVEDTP
jgi:hypothetical protein